MKKSFYDVETVKRAGSGNWDTILTQYFGVSGKMLKNKHGPCPVCGGNDRFRYDNRNNSGSYFCNQCGSGDGFDLCVKVSGDFYEALKVVAEALGVDESERILSFKDRVKAARAGRAGVDPDSVEFEEILQIEREAVLELSIIAATKDPVDDDHEFVRRVIKVWDSKIPKTHYKTIIAVLVNECRLRPEIKKILNDEKKTCSNFFLDIL